MGILNLTTIELITLLPQLIIMVIIIIIIIMGCG